MFGSAGLSLDHIVQQLKTLTNSGSVEILDETTPPSPYRMPAKCRVFPQTEEEVSAILLWAREAGIGISPQGGGSRDACGYTEAPIILSLRRFDQVMIHSVGDLIVTVGAGTTLEVLQRQLARAGQFLPLDLPWREQTTVGGMIAANASGPRRAAFGSIRDHLIAARVVYPDGRILRTGAKVVKNVAGYDMNKLFVGSMGTLGIITEATFKIRPIPLCAGYLLISGTDDEQLRALQHWVLDAQLEPCAMEWLSGAVVEEVVEARDGNALHKGAMLLSFEDVEQSVQYQIREVMAYAASHNLSIRDHSQSRDETEAVLAAIAKLLPTANHVAVDRTIVSVKVLSTMSVVPDVAQRLQLLAEEAGLALRFAGGAMTGISRATLVAAAREQETVVAWLLAARQSVKTLGGKMVIDFAPRAIRSQLEVWDDGGGAHALMAAIKRTFDPAMLLNPGRFVGGI